MTEWDRLSNALKLQVAFSAFQKAIESLAIFAETMASEIAEEDLSGPEMLRLFADMIRAASGQSAGPAAALN